MNRQELKELQAPLKALYEREPGQAIAEMRVRGRVQIAQLSCVLEKLPGSDSQIVAGLHPKAGGDGSQACSADMLLQSLVACAGVTLAAVITAMELPVQDAELEAVGVMDFRGTLGVSRDVAIGLTSIQLIAHLRSTATAEQIAKLLQLTERYCVIAQTLRASVPVSVTSVPLQ